MLAILGVAVTALTGRGVRWLVAAGVTVAGFAAPTVVSGEWLLPVWLHDAPTCWGVASGLGVALAALAALWGHGYATGVVEGTTSGSGPGAGSAVASGVRSVAVRGPVGGSISTGDSVVPGRVLDARARTRKRAEAGSAPPVPDVQPGSAVASGERAVAVNGEVTGDISTGDTAIGDQIGRGQ